MNDNEEIVLEAKQVSLSDHLGFTEILKDISVQIRKRDRAVILGKSGSGKTSFLRLLNRLSEPTTGSLYFHNTPYDQIPVLSLRQQIVLVPQEPKLLGVTVQEALAYPLILQQLSPTEINHRIATYCEQLQIPESWLDKGELELSLGQRQLVTIARGLVMQPEVLLLDEPTSALDFGIATKVMAFLKTQEMTILMVNHQLDIAEQCSDRVLFFQEGRLAKNLSNDPLNWQQLKQEII
ncbi:ABC transporter related protein [Halothece sp. PCC 7418]|uniref:ABC transporter ATP-binding protein n=1 Tax=Halothece sp. (strain PCC 7418) TaxID=65093 RepID=UPI0002A08D4A|nr:ATP-binding cassette domain-containing protein [Halothece sp. PCC 7418]AFZ43826.1 ABC transporter related protein [Halothece sp. PCC 7418]